MYVENLFREVKAETERLTNVHYRVRIRRPAYETLKGRIANIFFENYEKISLLNRVRKGKEIWLVLVWHTETWEERGG